MVELARTASTVFLQPTTLCNLDCSYCYLPDRALRRTMSMEVADAVAAAAGNWSDRHSVRVVWHGGEPLAVGPRVFAGLLRRFPSGGAHSVVHAVQTNATLVDDEWCEVFAAHRISVSVSIDGPAWLNAGRVDRGGRASFEAALRGIRRLRSNGVRFSAIAVVEAPTEQIAPRLYDWFAQLGCHTLGINIAERKGVYAAAPADDEHVTAFWTALADRWQGSSTGPRVREFDYALRYISEELSGSAHQRGELPVDPLPMIAWNGDVTLFGPDLTGFSAPRLGPLTVGNILDTGLDELLRSSPVVPWVAETLDGIASCRSRCDHFDFCLGGQAANKYFETGRFDADETAYCRNARKRLMEGLITHVERG